MWGSARVVCPGTGVPAILGLALAAVLSTAGSSAQATFPGTNGLIAFVNLDGNVFVVDQDDPLPVQVTTTGNFRQVAYDATGNKLVASNGEGLVLLDPVAGSAVTPIPNTTGNDSNPSFNPAGDKIAFANGNIIFTIDVAGTNRTPIFTPGVQPDWSPDGTFIAFADPSSAAIRRISPGGGVLVTLATKGPGGVDCGPGAQCDEPTVSPDGTKVAYGQINQASGGLAQVNADGTTVTPIRLTTGSGDFRPTYAPDGTRLAFLRGVGNALSTVPSDGSGTVTAVDTIAAVVDASWGPVAVSGPPPPTSLKIDDVTGADGSCGFTIIKTGADSATTLKVATAAVSAGLTSRKKKLRVVDVDPDEVAIAAGATTGQVTVTFKGGKKTGGTITAVLFAATGDATIDDAIGVCTVAGKSD